MIHPSNPSVGIELGRGQERLLVIVLGLASFLGTLNLQVFAPILPQVGNDLRTSPEAVGQFVTVSGLAAIVVSMAVGPWLDAWGRRPLFLVAVGSLAATSFAAAAAGTYFGMLLVRLVSGAGVALLTPAALALVGDGIHPKRQSWAMGFVIAGTGVAAVAGWPAVALATEHWGWRVMFILFGAVLSVLLALAWRGVPHVSALKSTSALKKIQMYRTALGDRAVLRAIAGSALIAAAWFGLVTYLGAYLS